MYIEYTNPKIKITNEEESILRQALQILINFEAKSSDKDDNALQAIYDEYTDCVDHQMALPTAIDLLTVIVGVD